MRLLSAWRKLLSGEEDDTGPEGVSSHWRAGILAGLACGTVAVHALASTAWERPAAGAEHVPGQRERQQRRRDEATP